MSQPPDLPIVVLHFCFVSRKFDLAAEPENDINPIRGQSFLAWLRARLEALGQEVDGPDTEDWGWYLGVRTAAGRYIVGASVIPDDDGDDWTIRLWRERSLREWITGKGRVTREDDLARLLERLVREEMEATESWTEEYRSAGPWRSPVHRFLTWAEAEREA